MMGLPWWRSMRLRLHAVNYRPVDKLCNQIQESQGGTTICAHYSILVPYRSISFTGKKGSTGSTGRGESSENGDESSMQDGDGSMGAGDKRMWRQWIEERLGQSNGTVEESHSSFSKTLNVKESGKRSSIADKQLGKERTAAFTRSSSIKENGRFSLGGEESGTGKRSPSLESFFKSALKSSSNSGLNGEDQKSANLKNPFRRENTKSSFFPNRESTKFTNLSSKRSSFFKESAARPSFSPVKQMPSKSPEVSVDDLAVEDLDEFEKRVLGSAYEVDETCDDDFLRELDEIGRSARGIQDEDNYSLAADEDEDWDDGKVKGLTDLALANAEEFDLEDEEHPYRLRPDRLFFPGQTYEPEDLDLSKAPELEKPTARTRKRYPSKEVFQVADFRNPRYLSNFLRPSSKIIPRRHFQLSAKAQRKVAREIKTARILGLMPFTSMGDPPFRFLRSWSEEDNGSRFDDF